MKKVVIFLVSVFFVGRLFAQFDTFEPVDRSSYYYADGRAIHWTTDSTSANIIVGNMAHYHDIVANLQGIFNSLGDEIWADDEDNNIIVNSTRLPHYQKDALIEAIQVEKEDIIFFTYARIVDGSRVWLSNEVLVKYKPAKVASRSAFESALANYDLVSIRQNPDYEYSVLCRTDRDVAGIANMFYDTTKVEYSTPDFYRQVELNTNDPYFSFQWALYNTGQSGGTAGVDINVQKAWSFLNDVSGSTGSGIKVAVIDDGVEEHEDMRTASGNDRVLPGYTANGDGTGRPRPNCWHGECCAGIIAASHNNMGVAGVAPNSLIVPIRIFKNNGRTFSDKNIANAITKSWETYGAAVLSNSWGGGSSNDRITNAIKRAQQEGRGGKGCVVVFSAGNNSRNSVSYPANSNPNIIAVGAMTRTGARASFSNYGDKLSIVAPGVEIPTTDRMGSAGRVSGNYYVNFGGTSAACPHVSGVAALILSANPNLRMSDVKSIIESTARKLPNYVYLVDWRHPESSWNPEVGYGVVDAYKAVVSAWFFGKGISGQGTISECEKYTYSFPASLPSGYSLHWRVDNGLVILSGQNTNTIEVQLVSRSQFGMPFYHIYVDVIKSGEVIHTLSYSLYSVGTISSAYNTSLSSEDFTVSSNTTWSGYKVLGVKATVPAGVTLTVTGIIKCTDNASITVQPGGKILIDGGSLSSLCTNKLWTGIVVLGNREQKQTAQYQGTAELKNGAVIEHAICAISAAPSNLYSYNGGIIKATDATFRNNLRAIEYCSYAYQDSYGYISNNVGNFTRCTFTIDANNYFAATGRTFRHHVTMWNVKGVTFSGCNFYNIDRKEGKGIYAEEAGFKIKNYCFDQMASSGIDCACRQNYSTPTLFQNFDYGIQSNNTGNPYEIFIDQSEFRANNTSVDIQSSNNYRLTRSNFYSITGWGLNSVSSSGYRIEENYFQGLRGNSIGIEMNNSGSANNQLFKNSFTNLNKGISIKSRNSNIITAINDDIRGTAPGNDEISMPYYLGLQIICNNFTINNIDISIEPGANIRTFQGSSSAGADNTFSGTSTSSLVTLNTQSIVYYHSPGNGHAPFNPILNSGSSINGSAIANPCKSTFCLPQVIDPDLDTQSSTEEKCDAYRNLQDEFDKLAGKYEKYNYGHILAHSNSQLYSEQEIEEARQYAQKIDELSDFMREKSNNAISEIIQDSILNTKKLKSWYDVICTPTAKYALAETHLMTNDYKEADNVLQSIPVIFDFSEAEKKEHDNYMLFYDLKKQLQLSDRNWTQLNESEIETLQNIVDARSGRSANMAQGVLCFFYEICPQEPDNNIPVPKSIVEQTRKDLKLNVYPNPTQSEVVVSIDDPDTEITQVEVYDLFGRLIQTKTLNKSHGKIEMNDLPDSIYVLKAHLNNGDTMIQKVVKQ